VELVVVAQPSAPTLTQLSTPTNAALYRPRMRLLAIVIVVAAGTAHAAPCADGNACVAEGKRLEAAKDPAAAFAAYDRGCQLHEPRACAMVGVNLLKDVGGTGDHAKNVELARLALVKSCDGGAGLGCYHLGNMAHNGVGMKPDPALAYAMYDKACSNGEMNGCLAQGHVLATATGVAKDEPRALALFEKACTAEVAHCWALAAALDKGMAGKRDEARARTLFTRSCDSGTEPLACYSLAIMIAGGRGGPANSAEAHRRLDQACKGGVKRACN
jgi:uncharacterized protein